MAGRIKDGIGFSRNAFGEMGDPGDSKLTLDQALWAIGQAYYLLSQAYRVLPAKSLHQCVDRVGSLDRAVLVKWFKR